MKKQGENLDLSPSERFLLFINRHGGLSSVCDKTGLQAGTLSNHTRGKSKFLNGETLGIIVKHYPNLNLVWYLNGTGSMLRLSEEEATQRLLAKKSLSDSDFLEKLKGLHVSLGETIASIRPDSKA